MMDGRWAGALLAAGLATASPAGAAVIAASQFDSGDEGWRNGEFTVGGSTEPVHFDPGGFITVEDNFPFNAFLAPGAFLGDQSAANGGALSFDLGSDLNDGEGDIVLVTLRGAGVLLFGGHVRVPPATAGFTHYRVQLRARDFLGGSPGAGNGVAVSDELFADVLRGLEQVSIVADLHSGEDRVRLDNVILSSGAVPEPAAWALMIAGFGLTGATLRRRRRAIV